MADQPTRRPRAALTVDGKKIGLNRFVEAALVGIVEGYLSALRDIGSGDVTITIPAERRNLDDTD